MRWYSKCRKYKYKLSNQTLIGWMYEDAKGFMVTLVIGIPLRYMHTPVELVSIQDIQRAGRLLAEFIAGLTPDFMEKIVWDD